MNEMRPLDLFFAETVLKKGGIQSEVLAHGLGRLMQGSRLGHLCMIKEELGIESLPLSIAEEGKTLFPKSPIIWNEDLIYLQKNWVLETYILQHTLRLRQNQPPSYFDRSIFETKLPKNLLPAQGDAIRAALKQSLTLICGGPGTGKTYTAAHLVNLLFSSLNREEKKHFRVCVAAPTGKAASHLQSALQTHGCTDPALHIQASTLHRLLKLQPGSSRLFQGNRIDADLIIVDEASMIDISLLAHLLESVGDESLLVLIGDPNQLPPIEAGSLFSDMSLLFGVHLDRCMRTEDRQLQELAQAVKQGEAAEFFRLGNLQSELLSAEVLFSRIDPVVSATDPQACLEKYNRFRILNAIRQGSEGSDALNRQIFQLLQKKGRGWAAPILATVNDPFSEIYNGMSGILMGAAAYFPDPTTGEMRCFPTPPPHELAFCLSIHKSQGSEFEEVLALFPLGSENFGRESLYTAITRAKKKIEIRGSKETIEKMIASSSHRRSGFLSRMRAAIESN